ncbi:GIY-YIG nuclease family protein [Deinococcus sp. YIM 134068]|uniref:GIY-YIG nuclease family protein n=1 Tax=Deinococcus lichenicola TaxID=3118910 RepID=UPI002F94341F
MSDELLAQLGFPPWTEIRGRPSVADLYRPGKRCGIYTMGFETGERYVGQAVDVVRRFSQHRRTHADITHIAFQPCAAQDLNQTERRCIHTLEAAGVALRNIALMSVVSGERDLDLVLSPDEQTAWLNDHDAIEESDDRIQDDALRRRHRRKYERLLGLPHAQEALFTLGLYLNAALPAPRRTELTFWMVSCLPYGVGREETLYARVSLNMQEVFSLIGSPESLSATFHLARTPFEEELGEDWMNELTQEGWGVSDHAYAPGGQDQFQLCTDDAENIHTLMLDPTANAAMALLNLRLMRKGPTYYGPSHCLDLVDGALCAFQADLES